jgi:hypothetical protein
LSHKSGAVDCFSRAASSDFFAGRSKTLHERLDGFVGLRQSRDEISHYDEPLLFAGDYSTATETVSQRAARFSCNCRGVVMRIES